MSYTKMYYIQDTRSYVGNSVIWWAHNGRGYICDLRAAGIFTEEEAKSQCASRSTDKMWPVLDIIRLVQHQVDIQDLGGSKAMPHTIKNWSKFTEEKG